MEYSKVAEHLKEPWLKALRSGKYRQAKSSLCETVNKRNSYCCLGVLARVAGAQFKNNNVYGDSKTPYLDGAPIKKEGAEYLVDGFAGLDNVTQGKLGTMNDEGVKFWEIADWIEKNL